MPHIWATWVRSISLNIYLYVYIYPIYYIARYAVGWFGASRGTFVCSPHSSERRSEFAAIASDILWRSPPEFASVSRRLSARAFG